MRRLLLTILYIACLSGCATTTSSHPLPLPADSVKTAQPIQADFARSLQAAEARWKQHGLKNYTYTSQASFFFCHPRTADGCPSVEVTVQDGKGKRAVSMPTRKPLPVTDAQTIEALFASIHKLMADKDGYFIKEVSYHPYYGYPTLLLSHHRTRTDSGTLYTVNNLKPLASKVPASEATKRADTATGFLVGEWRGTRFLSAKGSLDALLGEQLPRLKTHAFNLNDAGDISKVLTDSGYTVNAPTTVGHFTLRKNGFIPLTVNEAVQDIMSKLPAADKKLIRTTIFGELIHFHHTLGTGIRNDYGLYRGNDALLGDACKGVPRKLDDKGKSFLYCHPDDASMVIIKAVWHKLQTKSKQ